MQKFDVGGVAGRKLGWGEISTLRTEGFIAPLPGAGDPHLASVRIKVARQRELRHVLGPEGVLANQEELTQHARAVVDRVYNKLAGTDFNHGQ